MTEYREVDFIPANWMEIAAWWPGLQIHSRRIRVPVDPCPKRRKTDFVATTPVNVIERSLREALLDEPMFEPIDPDEVEALLVSLDAPEDAPDHLNTVTQLVER